MIKNNLKSLLIHIIISFFSIYFVAVFFLSTAKWASEEAAISHHNQMIRMSIIYIVIALILYFIIGRIFLVKQGNLLKNVFSTLLVAIIGLLFWVIAYKIDYETMRISYSLSNSRLWQHYFAFNAYSSFFLYETNSKNYLFILLFAFMPSIAMEFGLLSKYVPKHPAA